MSKEERFASLNACTFEVQGCLVVFSLLLYVCCVFCENLQLLVNNWLFQREQSESTDYFNGL